MERHFRTIASLLVWNFPLFLVLVAHRLASSNIVTMQEFPSIYASWLQGREGVVHLTSQLSWDRWWFVVLAAGINAAWLYALREGALRWQRALVLCALYAGAIWFWIYESALFHLPG